MPSIAEVIAVLAIIAVFSIVSLKRNSLDEEGALIAAIVGLLVYWMGTLAAFSALLVFFVVADSFTKICRKINKKEHEKRTTGNILGNAGSGMIALFFGSTIGFFGAMSAALADTLSSEIGMLSKEKTVLITNPKQPVPAGTDGGITLLGLEAAVLGTCLMSILYYFFSSDFLGSIVVIASGFLGSLADSLLGAVFERKKLLNNAEVNFFGSGTGALTAHFGFSFLH